MSNGKTKTVRLLRVFLCHSVGDKPAVRDLCARLRSDGFDPWLDEENLLPGQDWREEIPKAVADSDVVLVCLTKRSVTKDGYIQKEIRLALDEADEKPEGTIFIIPLKLEACDMPNRLRRYQWASLPDPGGYERMVLALKRVEKAMLPSPSSNEVVEPQTFTEAERVHKRHLDFIANVSHELRTPLVSIQGYAETLLESARANNSPSCDFLEIIIKNANRMSRLTEDLIVLRRLELAATRFNAKLLSPVKLLREAEDAFREAALGYGVELSILGEDSLDTLPMVVADRDAVQQLFSELIGNALRWGGSGGRVVLGARSAQNGVDFYVQDFGPGIPPEALPRVFGHFFRVDKARSREAGGTGLGLTIAKQIVLSQEGSIRVESETGHGSTFVFTLPTAWDSPIPTKTTQDR